MRISAFTQIIVTVAVTAWVFILPVKAVATILAEAKAAKVDMIAIGSHGKGAIKTLLVGSVTQKVVALSPVPVLVVH